VKAVLEFELPMDKDDLTLALHGPDWWLTVWDLKEWLRGELKYNVMLDDRTAEAYDKVLDKIYDLLDERCISLEEVS
jgi:hypothetical protein